MSEEYGTEPSDRPVTQTEDLIRETGAGRPVTSPRRRYRSRPVGPWYREHPARVVDVRVRRAVSHAGFARLDKGLATGVFIGLPVGGTDHGSADSGPTTPGDSAWSSASFSPNDDDNFSQDVDEDSSSDEPLEDADAALGVAGEDDPPPPYSPPIPLAGTLGFALSAPNMAGAFTVDLKATEVQRGLVPGIDRTNQTFIDVITLSPQMSFLDLRAAFISKAAAHHYPGSDPEQHMREQNEGFKIRAHVSKMVDPPWGWQAVVLKYRTRRVFINEQNWPDVVLAMKEREYKVLKVVYKLVARRRPQVGRREIRGTWLVPM